MATAEPAIDKTAAAAVVSAPKPSSRHTLSEDEAAGLSSEAWDLGYSYAQEYPDPYSITQQDLVCGSDRSDLIDSHFSEYEFGPGAGQTLMNSFYTGCQYGFDEIFGVLGDVD